MRKAVTGSELHPAARAGGRELKGVPEGVAQVRERFDFALREGYLLLRTKAGERVWVLTHGSIDELLERAPRGAALPFCSRTPSGRWAAWSAG
jgi:hypothetical protein